MFIKVYLFGIAKELFGKDSVQIELNNSDNMSIADLKSLLETYQPSLGNIGSYLIAVNNEYATESHMVHEKDEVAIIPPVSGG